MSEHDEYLQQQREMAEEDSLRHIASTQAAQPEALQGLRDPRFLDQLGNPDVGIKNDPDDDLDELVATETSQWMFLGNLDDDEYEKRVLLNQNLAERTKAEFPDLSGPGNKCVGSYRAIMTGSVGESQRPNLTPELARRIDSAIGEEGVRSSMLSLSRNGTAWDGISKIQTVASTESESSGASSAGILGGAKKVLFGGD